MTHLLQDPDVPLWVSDSAQDFLSKTLVKDPAKRSKASDLVKHPWLKSLGLKAPASQAPVSIAVVEPVLEPRVVISEPDVVVSQIPEAEEQEEEKMTPLAPMPAPIEIAVTASGTANKASGFLVALPSIAVWSCLRDLQAMIIGYLADVWSSTCMNLLVGGKSMICCVLGTMSLSQMRALHLQQPHQHHPPARTVGKPRESLQQQLWRVAGICSTELALQSQRQSGTPWLCPKWSRMIL